MVFENRVRRRIFGPNRETRKKMGESRILCNEDLDDSGSAVPTAVTVKNTVLFRFVICSLHKSYDYKIEKLNFME
jgi:hypothetical protein